MPVSFIKGKNDTLKHVAGEYVLSKRSGETDVTREARKNGTLINRRNARKRLRDVRSNGSRKDIRINVTVRPQYFPTIKLNS